MRTEHFPQDQEGGGSSNGAGRVAKPGKQAEFIITKLNCKLPSCFEMVASKFICILKEKIFKPSFCREVLKIGKTILSIKLWNTSY